MNLRRYGYASSEPRRCTCEPGADAHELHWRPKNRAARHTGDCRHSELWRTAVILTTRRPNRTMRRLVLLA